MPIDKRTVRQRRYRRAIEPSYWRWTQLPAPTVTTVTPTPAALTLSTLTPTVTNPVTVTPAAASLPLTTLKPFADFPVLWGTLLSDATRAATAVASGVDVVHQELGWDLYETSDGTFSSSYASASLADLNTWKAAGLRVMLGAGTWYPPAWALALTNAKYVNQNARNPASGYNLTNTMFSQAMRNQHEAYYTKINTDLGLNNYWAIRIGAGGNVQTLSPHANDGAGQTNSWWLYDSNAQSGGADLPSGVGTCPVASYVPGAGTATDAQNVLTWYMNALINNVNWQINFLRTTLSYTGYIIVTSPGVGIQPWLLPHIYNDLLAGTIDASRVSNRGAIWHLLANGITNKTKVILYCASAVDDSGSPANNLSDPSFDKTVDIVNDEAVRDFSAMRWLQTLAWQYGYSFSGGENPDASHPSYSVPMMTKLGQQANIAGWLLAAWAHEDNLESGAVVTWSNWAATIATTDLFPPKASLTLTAITPVVSTTAGTTVIPTVAALTLATIAPALRTTVTPTVASLSLTTIAPSLITTLTPSSASLTLATIEIGRASC